MRLKGKRVLVIGGTGFIGGRLVEKLLIEEGAEVRVLVRSWHKAVWVSRTVAELVPGDVTDRDSLVTAMRGCDLVVHCASGGNDTETFTRTNVDGTRHVIEVARELSNLPIVYLSSIAVHGPQPPDNVSEESPFVSTGKAYGESKIAAERLIQEMVQRHAAKVTVIRPTFVWGPRSHLFTTGPLRQMLKGQFRLIDEGRGTCHAVYVDNLVESIILASLNTNAWGRAFIVTDQAELTWAEFFRPLAMCAGLAELRSVSSTSWRIRLLAASRQKMEDQLSRLAGSPAPIWRRVVRRALREVSVRIERAAIPSIWDLQKYSRTGRVDTSAARDILGYQPVLSFPQAAEQTVEWIQRHLDLDALRS